MRKYLHAILPTLFAAALISLPFGAQALHTDDPSSQNMHPMGHDIDPVSLFDPLPPDFENRNIHTDIAFWGDTAIQGNWNGFRILDVSAPGNPKLVKFVECDGEQGDVVVWDNLVIRSSNDPNTVALDRKCIGQPIAVGFEGIHIIDISDVNNPQLVAEVPTDCGSHTLTLAPDTENGRLIVYVNSSNSSCAAGNGGQIDVVEVKLDDPASASVINSVVLQDGANRCHDMSVFTGDVNRAVCASDSNTNVYDISDLANPQFLYSITETGVSGTWHSAGMTWDGKVIVLGSEPGGGTGPRCRETDADSLKSLFFYDSSDGTKIGQWVLPRPQSSLENCTIHNYNVVPMRDGSYIIVHGSYQSGTSVVDFSDPQNPVEVAYSDPPPLTSPLGFDIGGAWSSYWYNNFMYESNITEGLNVFLLSDKARAGAMRLPYLNPQTQEFTIAPKGK